MAVMVVMVVMIVPAATVFLEGLLFFFGFYRLTLGLTHVARFAAPHQHSLGTS